MITDLLTGFLGTFITLLFALYLAISVVLLPFALAYWYKKYKYKSIREPLYVAYWIFITIQMTVLVFFVFCEILCWLL